MSISFEAEDNKYTRIEYERNWTRPHSVGEVAGGGGIIPPNLNGVAAREWFATAPAFTPKGSRHAAQGCRPRLPWENGRGVRHNPNGVES
jgi:hypothetical protein